MNDDAIGGLMRRNNWQSIRRFLANESFIALA
jgi:hypothetical protein